jgi:hypothetical protein
VKARGPAGLGVTRTAQLPFDTQPPGVVTVTLRTVKGGVPALKTIERVFVADVIVPFEALHA